MTNSGMGKSTGPGVAILEGLQAVVVTLIVGVALMFAVVALPDGPWHQPLLLLAMALGAAAGIAMLTRRYRANIVPISAIYFVVMFGVLLYVGFLFEVRTGHFDL